MVANFDIFREDDNGVHWLGAVADLETAKRRAQEIMIQVPGRYFVFNQKTGNRMYIEPMRPNERERTEQTSSSENF